MDLLQQMFLFFWFCFSVQTVRFCRSAPQSTRSESTPVIWTFSWTWRTPRCSKPEPRPPQNRFDLLFFEIFCLNWPYGRIRTDDDES